MTHDESECKGKCSRHRTMAPITLRVNVTQVQAVLLPQFDIRNSTADLTRNEGSSSTRTLVIKEDTVAGIHIVRLAIVDRDPVSVEFGNTIRRPGIERSDFGLRRLNDLPVELRSRRLIEPDVVLQPASTDSIEQAKGA